MQDFYARKIEDRIVIIMATYIESDQKKMETMMGGFSALNP